MRAILLGAALVGAIASVASAQNLVPVQYPDRRDRVAFRYREGYADSPRRFGYEDGYNDGVNDRRTGHSFRPTHDDNYHHADRGYYPGFGSKNYYKQIYREGYEQGYRQGYDNGWRH